MMVVNKILKLLFAVTLVLIMAFVVAVNMKLSYKPEITISDGDTIQIEIMRELKGVKNALDRNADVEMQAIYPEGYVFLNASYALAWSLFIRQEAHHKFSNEGQNEIQGAWMRINSELGKSSFNEDLTPPYGSFYTGWSSYVLGSKLRLESIGKRDHQEINQFKQECYQIANAIQQSVYPPSYHGGSWPADVTVCIAALYIHDELFEPIYEDVIEKWLSEVKRNLDSRGMIPHAVDPSSGKVREDARGSSMALTLIFLHDIDLQFATTQFLLFKENFVDTRFGLTGIREYPIDHVGSGDVDSGPIILGFGGAATIVGMQTLSVFGEDELSLRIRNAVESTAFPFQSKSEKRYLFGALPMADAFIVWSHSGMRHSETQVTFFQFHVYSLLVFAPLSIVFWILVLNKHVKSARRQ